MNDFLVPIATVIISAGVSWLISHHKLKYSVSLEVHKKLIEGLFIPFYEKIELKLFRRIPLEETREWIEQLKELKSYLQRNELLFYLPSRLNIELDKIANADPNSIVTKRDHRQLQKQYWEFSSQYFIALNRTRKLYVLKKHTDRYRAYHKLNPFPRLFSLSTKVNTFIITLGLISLATIVFFGLLTYFFLYFYNQ